MLISEHDLLKELHIATPQSKIEMDTDERINGNSEFINEESFSQECSSFNPLPNIAMDFLEEKNDSDYHCEASFHYEDTDTDSDADYVNDSDIEEHTFGHHLFLHVIMSYCLRNSLRTMAPSIILRKR